MYVSMPQHQDVNVQPIHQFAIQWTAVEREQTPAGWLAQPVARTDYVAAFTKQEAEAAFNRQQHMLVRVGLLMGLFIEDVYEAAERREELEAKYSEYEGYDQH